MINKDQYPKLQSFVDGNKILCILHLGIYSRLKSVEFVNIFILIHIMYHQKLCNSFPPT